MNFKPIVARSVLLWIAVVGLTFGHSVPASAAKKDTRPPDVPTGVTASATGCGQVTVSWITAADNPGGTGVASYDVFRNSSFLKSVAAPTTSTSDSGLAAGMYSYAV